MKAYMLSYILILNLLRFDLKISRVIKNKLAKKRKTHAVEAAAEVNYTNHLFHGVKHISHGNMGKEG